MNRALIATIALAILMVFFLSAFQSAEIVQAGPPSFTPPAAPKTRDQIASEAYALEHSVKITSTLNVDKTFTTTEDFDGGTKSSSGGNYETETITDNSEVASGGFQLGSQLGDQFTFSDSDLNTFKWNQLSRVSGCNVAQINSTNAYVKITTDSSAECGASSVHKITGDFDVRIKVDVKTAGSADEGSLCVYDSAGACNRDAGSLGTRSGYYADVLTTNPFQFFRVVSGAKTQIGGDANPGCGRTYWLRIGRVTNTFTGYHSCNGSSWTASTTDTNAGMPSSFYVMFSLTDNGVVDSNAEFYSYSQKSGGLEAGGFRASGSWISESRPVTTDTFKTINIAYSGASSSNYVTAVSLFDSTGHYFFVDNTDLTTGSSHVYSLDGTTPNTWKVAVNLTGDGSGSATIGSVTVSRTADIGAGRKTSSEDDGLCGGSFTGDQPASGGSIWHDSVWTCQTVVFSAAQTIHMAANNTNVSLTVLNSKIDAGGLDGAIVVNDTTATEPVTWPGYAARITFRNSTLFNASSFIRKDNGGFYRSGVVIITLDNVTLNDFGTFITKAGVVEYYWFNPIHDSTVYGWNRGDSALCAFKQRSPDSLGVNVYDPTATPLTIRNSRFVATAGQGTGCVAGTDVRYASGNYFQGGFLQLVFGSGDGNGMSPDFEGPTEFVNWTGNYADNSNHTVFGFYGTGVGAFSNHLGANAYGTIYGNYINNSRYIPIQSSGNVSGLHVVGNYVRGPIPWPGGSPTFELAIVLGTQDHNSTVERNYLWDMDDTHISGITVGFATHDNVISNNVLYDIGSNHMRLEGQTLKYKNAECPASSCSDYSWKGSNNLVVDNYLSGGTTGFRAISVDSGYAHFIGNTVVSAGSGTMTIKADAVCDPNCTFTWVDWVDGWPNVPSVSWSDTIRPSDESQVWLRTGRTGALSVETAGMSVDLSTSEPSRFGVLQTPRCVLPEAATGGRTTTDAEVLAWTGQTCGPVADITHFTNGSYTAYHPEMIFIADGTTVSFSPIGHAAGAAIISVTEPGTYLGNLGTNWTINPGHNYKVSGTEPVDTLSLGVDAFPLIIFVALLTTTLVLAVKFKRWRDGRTG